MRCRPHLLAGGIVSAGGWSSAMPRSINPVATRYKPASRHTQCEKFDESCIAPPFTPTLSSSSLSSTAVALAGCIQRVLRFRHTPRVEDFSDLLFVQQLSFPGQRDDGLTGRD